MKNLLIIFALIATASLASCNKELVIASSHNSLIGKWKLTETLADIGDGKGSWLKSSEDNYYVKFDSSSNIESNIYLNIKAYQVIDSVHVMFTMTDKNQITYRYKVTDSTLELNPPCIEACGSRFERLADIVLNDSTK